MGLGVIKLWTLFLIFMGSMDVPRIHVEAYGFPLSLFFPTPPPPIPALSPRGRYISYKALLADSTPNNHGQRRQQANKYTRGCNILTHCGRITN